MTAVARKRGNRPSYPICVWNGIFDHCEKIGTALWEFLWLIDAVTLEQDGIGWVFSKASFKVEKIAKDFGVASSTVRRNLDRLKRGGYIVTEKARYGIIVGVVNSKKIRPQRPMPDSSKVSELESRPLESEHADRSKVSTLARKSERTGDFILMDNAVRQSKETVEARSPIHPAWKAIRIAPTELPPAFRKLCEGLWATGGDAPLFEFMGQCLDGWKALGNGRYPRTFVAAKAELGKSAGSKQLRAVGLPELEEIPWSK